MNASRYIFVALLLVAVSLPLAAQINDTDGISAVAHGIRNVARLGWRTNVGAVNLGRSNVTLRINIYDADGKTIKQGSTLDIPALGHRQASLPAEVDGGSVEFFVDDPSK